MRKHPQKSYHENLYAYAITIGFNGSSTVFSQFLSELKMRGLCSSSRSHNLGRKQIFIWSATGERYTSRKRGISVIKGGYCKQCDSAFSYKPTNEEPQHCGRKCASITSGQKQIDRANKAPKQMHTCEVCGSKFRRKWNTANRACSIECGKMISTDKQLLAFARWKASRHHDAVLSSHRARAKRFGCHYEPLRSIDILKKGNWKCAICQAETPLRLKGSQADNAPVVDHIIPMSKGGPHTWWNTQCLCRKCNAGKSNKYNNQFILERMAQVIDG